MVAPTTPQTRAEVRDVRVTDEGIGLRSRDDVVVDVTFDGRRVWSFWLQRDTVRRGLERFAEWPPALRRFLHGSTRLALVDHVADVELHAEEVTLGDGDDRIAVVDGEGRPLGLDKSLRLSRLFESRDSHQVAPLLDAVDTVVGALREAGIDAFVAYGTLLGAVRDGRLIGHDSDADLGYVSHHDHPVDVMLESFRLQRHLVRKGLVVTRYSGIAVKVHVPEADGTIRGLDVFGGFMRDGRLYLMGEIGSPFEESWVWPLSTVLLEEREVPAPARPEHLLAAMYGESWRVPDPAFEFEKSVATQARLNGWFRGIKVGQGRGLGKRPFTPDEPSAFVRWVHEREADRAPRPATFVDVGCGFGTDVAWLGRQGATAWGLDAHYKSYAKMRRLAVRERLPVTFRWVNLTETRSLMAAAAELGRVPGPRVVLARHVADAVDAVGRDGLLRLARLLARSGGRLYLQVLVGPDGDPDVKGSVTPLDLDVVAALVAAHGGRVDECHTRNESDADGTDDIARLVVSWT